MFFCQQIGRGISMDYYKVSQEEIEQLQRDLYSYPMAQKSLRKKYVIPIMDINDELSGLARKERNGKTDSIVYHDKKNNLITKRTVLEQQLRSSEEYLFTSRIDHLLSLLPEADRDLIYDKFFCNRPYSQLAELMMKDKSTVISTIKGIVRTMVRLSKK